MFKAMLTRFIIVALLGAFVTTPATYANTKADKAAQRAAQIKDGLAQLGTGREAQVQFKLRDHRKLTGFIAAVEADTFSFNEAATGATTSLRYADVAQVKGHNLGTGKKVAIGVGIGVGILLIVAVIAIHAWPDGTD